MTIVVWLCERAFELGTCNGCNGKVGLIQSRVRGGVRSGNIGKKSNQSDSDDTDASETKYLKGRTYAEVVTGNVSEE